MEGGPSKRARIGHVCATVLGKMLQRTPKAPGDQKVPYLRAGLLDKLSDVGELPFMYAASGEVQAYGVKEGDLLVAEGGDVGRSEFAHRLPERTIFQNSLHRVRLRGDGDIRFVRYALTSIHSSGFLDVLCNKATFGHLTVEKLRQLQIPWPQACFQQAIADYLDIETGRIDALISKKRRMIALLRERWIAGAEFVLSRFDSLPLKRYVTKIGSGSTPRGGGDVYVPSGPAFLRSQNIKSGVVDLSDIVFIDRVAQEELRRALVHPGDVLLNITGGSIGRAAVFDRSDIQAYVSQHVCIVRPVPGVDAGVLCAELSSHSVQEQIAVIQVGGNREGLNFEQVGNFLVRVPPSDQSQAIAQELATRFSRSVRTSETLRIQIDLLRERRQALITAAVTGELATPGMAA